MDQDLQQQVEAIAEHLVIIHKFMRRAANLDLAEFGLTAPQVNVLRVLSTTNGLSLKELSEQVGAGSQYSIWNRGSAGATRVGDPSG